MRRRELLAAALAPRRRPNIILILADDLGPGDLGCYGQKIIPTPNIDRLAREGTRLTDAYAGSMVCAPSRCTLMTGYHSGHATVRGNWEVYPEGQHPLAARDTTVAQTLKQAGYRTALCGKWGLGGPDSGSAPPDKGFDFFYGYNCQRHAHRFFPEYLWRNRERETLEQSTTKRTYAQELIVNESLRFIRENQANPFFLYCAWTVPHGPYPVDNIDSLGRWANEAGWSTAEKVYAAMVSRLDADVGRVLALVSELGLERDTLILFASDNGGGGGPVNDKRFDSVMNRRERKGSLREGGLRVPFIARQPGTVPAARTNATPVAFWDMLPTLAEWAGAKAPAGIDGVSLAGMLRGGKAPQREYLYWERQGPKQLTRALRFGKWKAYQETASAGLELFDLTADPGEKSDVAAAHPKVAERARTMLAGARTEVTVPAGDPRIWVKYKEDNARLDAKLGIVR